MSLFNPLKGINRAQQGSMIPQSRGIVEARWVNAVAPDSKGSSRSAKEGLRYEQRVKERLVAGRGASLITAPVFKYVSNNSSRDRCCVPDAVLLNSSAALVIEIKLQHHSAVWSQLRGLYQPVARLIFPDLHVLTLEICKHYDPHVITPETAHVIDFSSIHNLLSPATEDLYYVAVTGG